MQQISEANTFKNRRFDYTTSGDCIQCPSCNSVWLICSNDLGSSFNITYCPSCGKDGMKQAKITANIANKVEKEKPKEQVKKEHKEKANLPVWFDKEIDKTEATEEDVKEMDEILAGLV